MSTAQLAIVSGAFVGIVGTLAPSLTARLDRTHQRALAQAERRHALRAEVYRAAGAFLERQRLALIRIDPVWGPMKPPPDPLPDEEWARLEGSIAVASSPEVRAAISEAHRCFNGFMGAVYTYDVVKARPQQLAGEGQKMEEARKRAHDAINAAEQVMRAELDAL